MARWAPLCVAILAACAPAASVAPASSAPIAAAPGPGDSEPAPRTPAPAVIDPGAWETLREIVERSGQDSAWSLMPEDLGTLVDAGMTEAIALEGLARLAQLCAEDGWPKCGLDDEDETRRDIALSYLGVTGSEAAIPTLLSYDTHSVYTAGMALEDVLVARMRSTPAVCAPPTDADVVQAMDDLRDFVVLDPAGGQLVARPATADERSDLAYFLLAVAETGPAVGEEDRTHRSGLTPDPEDLVWRVALLEQLAAARSRGDAPAMLDYGTRYLQSLGYPGAIDQDLEADVAWGGARYSYVMRDVALAAEIEGEHGLAADLYRRANPGGGGCGTSVDYRRGEQIEGLIRTTELGGRCSPIVAERLLDWDGEPGSPYGPDRLVAAGFDVEQLYRGAFVTRHRDREAGEIVGAIERGPESLRASALARLRARGPEAWEARVFAVEGLADELGARGVELLRDRLDRTSGELRARTIHAIGSAARRTFIGPCPPNSFWAEGHGSNVWSRPIAMYGTGCDSRPSDAFADDLHAAIVPALHDGDAVKIATLEALGSIAAPRSRALLAKWQRRTSDALALCRRDPDPEHDCDAEQRLFEAADDASRRYAEISERS